MQYCQNLKSSDQENQNKGQLIQGRSRLELETRSKLQGKGKSKDVSKDKKDKKWEGKRLIRKREAWKDRVGMGTVEPKESFKVKETQKIRRDYLKELMYNEVNKNEMKFRTKFLSRHKVSSEVRVRMVSSFII